MSEDRYEGLGLSSEELAAIDDELDDSADLTDDGYDADDDAEEVVVQAEDAAEPEQEAEPEKAAPAESDPVEEVVPQQQEAPRVSPLDGLNAELATIKQKFDDGDISIDEYIDERDRISRAIVKAELKAEIASDEVAKSWERSQSDFLKQNVYLRENDIVYDAFAMQVNKILQTPKSRSMTDDEVLAAAKQKVDAAFGRAPEPHKKSESPVKKAKAEAADTSRVPQSLRGIPVAEPHDVDGSKFAYLDKLSGVEFEAAIAKLSSDDAARWARSQ